MKKQVLMLMVLVSLLLTACSEQAGPETFYKYTVEDVLGALNDAGLSVINAQQNMSPEGDMPLTFTDRYTFEIDGLQPGRGGQILIFREQARLDEWLAYIETLRNDSSTRSSVIYTFSKNNAVLQLDSSLMPSEATDYQVAFNNLP